MEEWKDIEGYEGLYQVSNEGRVKSLGKGGSHKTEKILKIQNGTKGYQIIRLCKNGTQKTLRIHRLVAEAFIENPNNYQQINHKDECKTNNFVSNLEWCNNEYNNSYGTRNKKVSISLTNGKTSKQVYQYTIDNQLVKTYPSLSEIARINNYSIGNVSSCCNGKRKTYKGYKWSYEPM